MGKSDKSDHRSDRSSDSKSSKSKKSDLDWNNANKVPLGRGGFFSNSSKGGSGSLLKPSYLRKESDSYSSSSSGSSMVSNIGMSSMPSMSSRPNLSSFSGYSQSSNNSNQSQLSGHALGKVMSTDYSRLSEPQIGKDFSNSSSYYSGYSGQHFSSSSSSMSSIKRENSDSNDSFDPFGGEGNDEGRERKRKRRSRWMGSSDEKAVIPGMPTILPSDLPVDQQEAYIAQLQIEELTRKLRSGDLGISSKPEDRSPSPEPIYGTDGKRLNTREYRTRKKLEEERHKLIQRLLKLNPDYKPPADYRAPIIKIVDRVPIPQEEHPEINFVGLLIGPRGNTLKGLEKDTGAKIIIRGKGSVKEGKVGGKAGHPLPGEDEPLHAYVTSNNPDSVKKACEKIKEIIRQGIDMPESQNDLRKNQLRELALLNGTLREGEGPKCSNCGATSHRTWHCPDKPNVTNSVICTVCGGAGHISRDCRLKRPGSGGPPVFNYNEKAKIDEEYMSLMAELGETAPPKEEPSRIMRTRPGGVGQNLFDKPSAPKAIAAPQPQAAPMMPPPQAKNTPPSSYPPPPGPPGYGSTYNPYMGYSNYGHNFPPNCPPPPPKWLPPGPPGPPPLPPGPPPQHLSPPQPPGS